MSLIASFSSSSPLWSPATYFICLKQRTLTRSPLKFIFSTLGPYNYCCSPMLFMFTYWKDACIFCCCYSIPMTNQGQPACSWLGLCSWSASQTFLRWLQKQVAPSLNWQLTQVLPLRFWSLLRSKQQRPGAGPSCWFWSCSYLSNVSEGAYDRHVMTPMTQLIKGFTMPQETGHKHGSGWASERHLSVPCFVSVVA